MAKPYTWRVFGVLYGAGLLSAIALLPYLGELLHRAAAHSKRAVPPMGIVQLLPAVIQSVILLAVATGVGLLLARKIALGAPILSAWLYEKTTEVRARSVVFRSIVAGLVSVLVVLALVIWVFIPRIPQILAFSEYQYPIWKRFLAALYGGIAEEILLRLFLMTLLAWLLGKIWYTKAGLPAVGALWASNVLAAVIFGLGHLPTAVVSGFPLNPVVIAYELVANGLLGITFGYLYMSFGIEAAMLAHFCADIVIHVVGPHLVH